MFSFVLISLLNAFLREATKIVLKQFGIWNAWQNYFAAIYAGLELSLFAIAKSKAYYSYLGGGDKSDI